MLKSYHGNKTWNNGVKFYRNHIFERFVLNNIAIVHMTAIWCRHTFFKYKISSSEISRVEENMIESNEAIAVFILLF